MPFSVYLQSVIFLVLAWLALFASAGTLAMPAFWIYLAILAAVVVLSLVTLDPGLAHERMRPGGEAPPRALRLFTLVIFIHWIVAGLDHGRWHCSDDIPEWLQGIGLVTVAVGDGLCFWAMAVNRFFSSIIRIQTDRGQYVVTTGPYAVIRHPGYTGGILFVGASGVALGSWLATALLVVVTVPFLLYRAAAEDRVLQAELAGYRDYAARVRWRLLPGIW